ncbi:predicted protein [Naegleria gruberi]|uniref:Predicted protein n=1 Tax=Naegleria gruberi TaxID=5762 RepID=D2V242_NAEGR|nr:uncharacterized protein NAEGRDRAFT_62871 [Naegleria gruberi]EFC48987.1 predicted protein [Naegleria gruberi]|eukprot:XP_002681731.1 predicted protein [Naegleria gruberi strain NEG-M]
MNGLSGNGHEEPSLYEKLLSERETFNAILDFSRRSYSSEPVLCFDTIQNYRKSRRMTFRMKIANNILETFLSKNSPLELNIPKIDSLHNELLFLIKEKNETKIDELLEELRVHCLLDMNEMMTRMNSEYPEMFRKAKQEIYFSTINSAFSI